MKKVLIGTLGPTFQLLSDWLKHIKDISVTLDTSQLLRGWLKESKGIKT